MAKNNNNKAAEAAALLLQKYNDALAALAAIPADATDEVKEAAQKVVDEVKAALDANGGGVLLIRFTKSPTGRFGLAYSEGEEAEFSMAQAAELVDAGFAEAVGSDPEPEA